MSYVPEYIRPVNNGNGVVTTKQVKKSTPSPYSPLPSPIKSDKLYGSYSARSPTVSRTSARFGRENTGYKEQYLKSQQQKLCGRRSLDERLKSLEQGAAVKLEV